MELQLIKIMFYGFGSALLLIFAYIIALTVFFIKHISEEDKEESF